MRILIFLVLGIASWFYLTEIFLRLKKEFKNLAKILPFNSSHTGMIAVVLGLIFSLISLSNPIIFLISIYVIGSGIGMLTHHLLAQNYIISKDFEHKFIQRHQLAVDRFLEMLPGILTWFALTSPFWLSFFLPYAVAYLIILADIYWLFSAFRYSALIFIGYRKMQYAKSQDWLKKLQIDFPDNWQNYYHLVMVPTYKESLEILKPTFEAIINSKYPKDRIILLVGFEGRDSQEKIDSVSKYLDSLKSKIAGVYTTIHPHGLPGEVPGQGTNRNWMIKHTLPEFKKRNIKPSQIFMTTLDADFVIHPQFLAGALHKYLSTSEDKRDVCSYTGVFIFHNNYWQTPAPMRLIATGTAFWQLSEMVGSDKYINYSSMSMNLKSIIDVGLWIPDKVNDDSGFYWKAYYHFNGKYKVIPHFLPISADAVLDINLIKTFQNQYLQLKRWAYGVEHIPFIFKQYFIKKDIDFWDKTDKLIFIMWSYFKWGTLALFITFAGLLIPLVNPSYSQSVISKNLTLVSSWILTAAFIGLFTTVYVNEKVAPKRPVNWGKIQYIWSYIQWILIPIVLVSIATIPALDAQTSLMFGRYLEFRVTNKSR